MIPIESALQPLIIMSNVLVSAFTIVLLLRMIKSLRK